MRAMRPMRATISTPCVPTLLYSPLTVTVCQETNEVGTSLAILSTIFHLFGALLTTTARAAVYHFQLNKYVAAQLYVGKLRI